LEPHKAKDDNLFNCSQSWEATQVAGHYGINEDEVIEFLKESCENGKISHSTHKEVYQLIKDELGYAIPV
jgi:hypothetical protein